MYTRQCNMITVCMYIQFFYSQAAVLWPRGGGLSAIAEAATSNPDPKIKRETVGGSNPAFTS